MHIELTDHLRCPEPHDEAFLVLLPDRMDGRRVVAGHLGCPVCGWSTDWRDGVPDFGDGWNSTEASPCSADDALTLLGLEGPGGWLALAGGAGALAHELVARLPGVHLVAINPPASVSEGEWVSVVRSARWPVKAHAMRALLLGADAAAWRDEAVRSVLPGLRAVGAGDPPTEAPGLEMLGAADHIWVARRR